MKHWKYHKFFTGREKKFCFTPRGEGNHRRKRIALRLRRSSRPQYSLQ